MPVEDAEADVSRPPVQRLWQKCAQLDYLEALLMCLQTPPPVGGWTDSALATAVSHRLPGRRWGTRPAAVQRAVSKFNLRTLIRESSKGLRTLTTADVDRVVKHLLEVSNDSWGVGQIVEQARLDGIWISHYIARSSMKRLQAKGRAGWTPTLRPSPGRCPIVQGMTHASLLLKLARTLQRPAPYPERWTIEQLARACEASENDTVLTLSTHRLDSYQAKLIDRTLWCTRREILELVRAKVQTGGHRYTARIFADLKGEGCPVQESEVQWAFQIVEPLVQKMAMAPSESRSSAE